MHKIYYPNKSDNSDDVDLKRKRNAQGFYFRKRFFPLNGRTTFTSDIDELEYRSRVNYITFDVEDKPVLNEELGSYRYLVLLFEPLKDDPKESAMVYFKAILGEPINFILRHTRKGAQGVVVQDSISGFNSIITILKGYPPSDVTQKIQNDAMECLNTYTRKE